MKIKLLFAVLVGFVLSIGGIVFVNAQATGVTTPTTDFGRDVANGVSSTKNDAVAQQEQKAVKDNESDGAAEDGDKVEAKEAAEVPEAPEAKEATEASGSKESGESSGSETKKSDSGSGTETGGGTTGNTKSND